MKPWLFLGLFMISASSAASSFSVTGATIHVGDGRVLKDHNVLVRDGQIVSVQAGSPPQADQMIRLNGEHLYPGLIALGSSLGLVEIEGVRATRDNAEVGEFTPDVHAWIAVNPDSELLGVARANGIAYAEVIPHGGWVAGWSGLLALDGWTPEQMTLQAPAALHTYWPSQTLVPVAKPDARNPAAWKSPEDQHKEREERLRQISEFFEDAKAYGRAKDSSIVPPAFRAVVPVVAGERPLAIHADDVRQIKSAIEFASTYKLRIVIYGGRDAWRLADELAAKKIPVVYQHVFSLPHRDSDSYDVHYKAPSILAKAGVKLSLALGGRFEATNLRNLPYVASQAMAFGLAEADALRAITVNPAEALGASDRIGTIEPGKRATFFTTSGSVFDIRTAVHRLWISGREIVMENRQTRLREKYRNRPSPTVPQQSKP